MITTAQLATRNNDDSCGDPIVRAADGMPVNMEARTLCGNAETHAAVEKMIERAIENNFPLEFVETLRTIIYAYDVWRLELRDDPPVNVSPLHKEGTRPTKCKSRKYPPRIRQFLREFNDRLVELRLVYENPKSRWVSPVLLVKKAADLMDLRQTTDYRALNEQTEVMAAVMPIISLVLENARRIKHFELFDFLKGF
ncbi:unnamed protein product [Phytophthora fragariaefolia]|uniref:Unnamed protein product n=1 Tax=Phytophthora fragariaefolia TaxID=1490495 RepID=A0A9W6Y4N9_9STRA|nr:unnamed protein product [Phytophthora fragariaefolia]